VRSSGNENSRSKGFLLAKYTAHNHPHHDEPFSQVAWYKWKKLPHPWEPLQSGLYEATIKGFRIKIYKLTEKLIISSQLLASLSMSTFAHCPWTMVATMASVAVGRPP